MPTSQHDEQSARWSSQSAVCVGTVKRQRTTNRAQSWSLVPPQTVMTWTRTLHGCRSRWHVRAGDCMWVSVVGGPGRRAVILRARMMGIIEASVHEREPRFFFFQGSTERARENGALACVTGWTNIPSEVERLFAHGVGTGVSCTPKVSLCDAMICVVASDFFGASRRPMCGHTPLLIILYALDLILQKSSNGQHRHAVLVGKHTWVEPPYLKFLEMTLSRLR